MQTSDRKLPAQIRMTPQRVQRLSAPASQLNIIQRKERVHFRCRHVVIGVSDACRWLQIGSRASLLVPLRDVFLGYFRIADTVKIEPNVGVWHASDLLIEGRLYETAMWTLTETTDLTHSLFFHGRFDCPEITIEPQYGGV